MLALETCPAATTAAPVGWMQALARPSTARPSFEGELADGLAIFAHDLRGPLANLALLIEAIGAEAQADGSVRTVERADRAERIIDRVAGRPSSEVRPVASASALPRPSRRLV
jgi:hypothetical protein